MDIEKELSKRLQAWFSVRRRVRELADRQEHEVATDEALSRAQEQLVQLRDQSYDCEWSLLSLGARKAVWERVLDEEEDESNRFDAIDLRQSVPQMDLVPQAPTSAEDSLKVGGWWFVPYALWVGVAQRVPGLAPPVQDHAYPMLKEVRRVFLSHIQDAIPSLIAEENQARGRGFRGVIKFVPWFEADRLRTLALPPGSHDTWPQEVQNAIVFESAPDNPLRAGCVGVYIAAENYRALASLRDMIREQIFHSLKEMSNSNLRFSNMVPKESAISEAELLRWELWAEEVVRADLAPEADSRHILFTTFVQRGQPVLLKAQYADLNDRKTVLSDGSFECRLDTPDMLKDALLPFLEAPRTDLAWTMRTEELPLPEA